MLINGKPCLIPIDIDTGTWVTPFGKEPCDLPICNFSYFLFWFRVRDTSIGSDCASSRSLLIFYFFSDLVFDLMHS